MKIFVSLSKWHWGLALILLIGLGVLLDTYLPGQLHHLLLVPAAAMILFGARALRRYRDMENWLEVPARLTKIIECEEKVAISGSSPQLYFYPEIEYEYSLHGQGYRGDRVGFEKENYRVAREDSLGDHVTATERWWLALRVGQEVSAYVNPRDARDAVLVRTVTAARRSHHLALIASGVLLGMLWIFLVAVN